MNAQSQDTRFFIKKDTVHIQGPLSENTRFRILKKWPKGLKINFSGVTALNGAGLRKFLEFLGEWGDRPLKYYDCPIELLHYVSEIGALRGAKGQAEVFVNGEKVDNLNAYLAGHQLPPEPLSLDDNMYDLKRCKEDATVTSLPATKEALAKLKAKAPIIPEGPDDAVSSSEIKDSMAELASKFGYCRDDGSADVSGWLDLVTRVKTESPDLSIQRRLRVISRKASAA